MSNNRGVIISYYNDTETANEAIHELLDAGISPEQIGVLARGADGKPEIEPIDAVTGSPLNTGVAIGAAVGAGGGALWALGVAAGVVPAIGPVFAGGLLAAVLTSAVGGGAAGGLLGALAGLGVADEDAEFCQEEFEAGKVVVVVDPRDRVSECMRLLRLPDGDDSESERRKAKAAAANITPLYADRIMYL